MIQTSTLASQLQEKNEKKQDSLPLAPPEQEPSARVIANILNYSRNIECPRSAWIGETLWMKS